MKKEYFRVNKKTSKLQIHWKCLKEKCPTNCCGSFENKLPFHTPINKIEHDDILLMFDEVKNFTDKDKFLKDGSYFLNLNKDRSCKFFKNNTCSCYDVRPAVCRAYPFYIDLFSGLNIDTSCPGCKKGWTDIDEIIPFFQALGRVYVKHVKNLIRYYA
jgi:Fe-S-cluster containining protein